MNRLISWCGNLITLDEEEQVIQFAHHTVQQFFLSVSNIRSLDSFHFQLPEINHEAGEACVTYLNFNDFKRQLVRSMGPHRSLEPKAILKASLSSGLNKTISRSWSRLGWVWGSKRGRNYNMLRQLQDGAGFKDLGCLRKLQTCHPFLAYASEYWLLHTAEFVKESTRTWKLWCTLLRAENILACTPWTSIEWTNRAGSVVQWILQYSHCALLKLITDSDNSGLSLPQREYLLVRSAAAGHLQFIDIILESQAALKVDLSIALQAAASGGHKEVVGSLLAVDTGANDPGSSGARAALQMIEEVKISGWAENLPAGPADVSMALGRRRRHPALQTAAEDRQLEGARKLLGVKPDVMTGPRTYAGRTALQAAAEGGHLEIVEMLLAAGADVNEAPASSTGRTAMQEAVAGGHQEVMALLEGAGARL